MGGRCLRGKGDFVDGSACIGVRCVIRDEFLRACRRKLLND